MIDDSVSLADESVRKGERLGNCGRRRQCSGTPIVSVEAIVFEDRGKVRHDELKNMAWGYSTLKTKYLSFMSSIT
jgi:hypothetical protein